MACFRCIIHSFDNYLCSPFFSSKHANKEMVGWNVIINLTGDLSSQHNQIPFHYIHYNFVYHLYQWQSKQVKAGCFNQIGKEDFIVSSGSSKSSFHFFWLKHSPSHFVNVCSEKWHQDTTPSLCWSICRCFIYRVHLYKNVLSCFVIRMCWLVFQKRINVIISLQSYAHGNMGPLKVNHSTHN